MVGLIWGEIQQKAQDGLRILLPAADAVWIFGEKIKLSCIAAVPQAYRRPRLVIKLLEKPDKVTPSVNVTTNREIASEFM